MIDANEVKLLMEGKPLPEKPRTPPTPPPQAAPSADPAWPGQAGAGFTRGESGESLTTAFFKQLSGRGLGRALSVASFYLSPQRTCPSVFFRESLIKPIGSCPRHARSCSICSPDFPCLRTAAQTKETPRSKSPYVQNVPAEPTARCNNGNVNVKRSTTRRRRPRRRNCECDSGRVRRSAPTLRERAKERRSRSCRVRSRIGKPFILRDT